MIISFYHYYILYIQYKNWLSFKTYDLVFASQEIYDKEKEKLLSQRLENFDIKKDESENLFGKLKTDWGSVARGKLTVLHYIWPVEVWLTDCTHKKRETKQKCSDFFIYSYDRPTRDPKYSPYTVTLSTDVVGDRLSMYPGKTQTV